VRKGLGIGWRPGFSAAKRRGDAENKAESVKGTPWCGKIGGPGRSAGKQVPPQPGTIPALGRHAGKVAVAISEPTTLVKEIAV
jgi:hypothetical protein